MISAVPPTYLDEIVVGRYHRLGLGVAARTDPPLVRERPPRIKHVAQLAVQNLVEEATIEKMQDHNSPHRYTATPVVRLSRVTRHRTRTGGHRVKNVPCP